MPVMKQEKQTQYGCFLIIPLKYDPDTLERARLEEIGDYRLSLIHI